MIDGIKKTLVWKTTFPGEFFICVWYVEVAGSGSFYEYSIDSWRYGAFESNDEFGNPESCAASALQLIADGFPEGES